MNRERVADLRRRWLETPGFQDAVNSALDRVGFTSAYVEESIASLNEPGERSKVKYIKDNVWGMIRLGREAVRLVDSPLVQRLRTVKQLGLSYLVYPSAEHSRFVHSVGMAHVVSQLLDEAAKRIQDGDDTDDARYVTAEAFHPLTVNEVVIAAILHDVGHMPFSHATETVLSSRPDDFMCGPGTVSDLLDEAGLVLSKTLKLAELLSLAFVLSKRFERFYLSYVVPGSDPASIVRIACLIGGMPPDPRLSGVAEVISSATVDADRIDYIRRDAEACGIPVGLDTSRTLLRCGFVRVSRDILTKYQLKDDPAPEELVFIVSASGMDTVDEITLARAALYQRVYLHAVTRTAESVLARALEATLNASIRPNPDVCDAFQIWSLGDEALLEQLRRSAVPEAATLADCLRLRRMPKKACVFSSSLAMSHMPLDELFQKPPSTSRLTTIRRLVSQSKLEHLRREDMLTNAGRLIEDEIREEASLIARCLRTAGRADLIPATVLGSLVIIGSAYMDRSRPDGLVLQNGELLRTSAFTNVREQQDAFDIFKAVGYVMCDPGWRAIVLVASRTILGRPVGKVRPASLEDGRGTGEPNVEVRLLPRMILDLRGTTRRAGLSIDRVLDLCSVLELQGYFDDKPHLAPTTDPGNSALVAIARRLGRFRGQQSWRVTPVTTAAFVDQFPPGLRDGMLKALAEVTVLDSPTMEQGLVGAISDIGPDCDVAGLTPNSGNDVRRMVAQKVEELGLDALLRVHNDVSTALRRSEDRPLVLVDDNLSSGTQARAQFLAWLGIPRHDWPEALRNERKIIETPLQGDEGERFRSRPVHLLSYVGRKAAGPELAELLNKHGMRRFGGLRVVQELEAARAWPPELRSFLTEVGLRLMAWTTYGKIPEDLTPSELEDCNGRSFGYGNFGALLTTDDNVPTSTVTALWCPGLVQGRPWMPLLLRKGKLRHLIVG